jgi:hypothetical protein
MTHPFRRALPSALPVDPPPGRRILLAALIGATLGAAVSIVVYVLPSLALISVLGAITAAGEGGPGVPTAFWVAAGVVVASLVALAALPLLRRAHLRPVWGVAFLSPFAAVALWFIIGAALEPAPSALAIIKPPLSAAGGYALSAAISTPGLPSRWAAAMACATAVLLPLALVIGMRAA